MYQGTYRSPLGDITLQSDGSYLTALYFIGQNTTALFPMAHTIPSKTIPCM